MRIPINSLISQYTFLLAVAVLAMLGLSLSDDGNETRRTLLGSQRQDPSAVPVKSQAVGPELGAKLAVVDELLGASDAIASPISIPVGTAQADPVDPAPTPKITRPQPGPCPPESKIPRALAKLLVAGESPWSKTLAGTRVALLEGLPKLDHHGIDGVGTQLGAGFQSPRKNLSAGRGTYVPKADRLGLSHPYGMTFGAIVGEFELAVPGPTAFILRGTLPVPPGRLGTGRFRLLFSTTTAVWSKPRLRRFRSMRSMPMGRMLWRSWPAFAVTPL
jgi:hypothetical protein